MSLHISIKPNELWLNYKTPAVRQLAFALLSPNIIQNIPSELQIFHPFHLHTDQHWESHYLQYIPRLQYLDTHPEDLYNFLNTLKSTRLGLRFEMFIWFWLLDHTYHPYQVIKHSLQIIDGAKTIGELDFLLKNTETNRIEHWEVALKYYLGEKDLSLPYWYGLNRTDTLFKKMHHFTYKQFQFAHVCIENTHEYPIDDKFAVIKGQLFLPAHYSNLEIPQWINPQRRLGLWDRKFPNHHAQYYRLERHEWLCPNAKQSTLFNPWWTNGLYLEPLNNTYYMYAQPTLI